MTMGGGGGDALGWVWWKGTQVTSLLPGNPCSWHAPGDMWASRSSSLTRLALCAARHFEEGVRRDRDALEGKAPRRRPQKRLDRRLEGVAKAVGGGYCRFQMRIETGTCHQGDVAGYGLGALEAGYLPPFQCIPGEVPSSCGCQAFQHIPGRGGQKGRVRLGVQRRKQSTLLFPRDALEGGEVPPV